MQCIRKTAPFLLLRFGTSSCLIQQWARPLSTLNHQFSRASVYPGSKNQYQDERSNGRRHFATASSLSSPASGEPAAQDNLPLRGITVVSLEQAVAGPFCTRQLAELGARVIKVERPGVGDFARDYDKRVKGQSSHFVWINRSKESLALDLKNSKDLAVLKKLLTRSDVLVQNLAPGASERLGLSFEALQESNPGLIVCDISGYGSDGPYRNKKAYDLLIQSESGLLSVTGFKGQPVKAGISVADISAGMYAYSKILAALILRDKTGKGSRLDISMLESLAEWMSFPLYYSYDDQSPPVPVGASHASITPYGPFETGAGSIMLGLQNEREWVNLCKKVLKNPSLATDARFATNDDRRKNRDVLTDIIHKTLAEFTADEAITMLDESGIANAKINDMQAVWDHPQLKARRRWTSVETPEGPIPAMLPPGSNPDEDFKMEPIPSVGQHNEKILAELEGTS